MTERGTREIEARTHLMRFLSPDLETQAHAECLEFDRSCRNKLAQQLLTLQATARRQAQQSGETAQSTHADHRAMEEHIHDIKVAKAFQHLIAVLARRPV